MHFGRSPFTGSCEWGKSLNNFKIGTFIGRFLSDGAANMAVKGLITKRDEHKIQKNTSREHN